jgi:hypothetical protein
MSSQLRGILLAGFTAFIVYALRGKNEDNSLVWISAIAVFVATFLSTFFGILACIGFIWNSFSKEEGKEITVEQEAHRDQKFFGKEKPRATDNTSELRHAIQHLSEFVGHTAKVEVQIEDASSSSETGMRSHRSTGYLMFRTPEIHNHYGFVVKGSEDNIAVLIKLEDKLRCLLYDQIERKNIAEGPVNRVGINFVTDEGCYVLEQDGLQQEGS